MQRRHFMALGAAALAAPGGVLGASGAGVVEYSRAAYEEALASGKPFMLDFYADW